MSYVIPTAEPFFYPRGRIGCLLIHGFTGAPKEMHEMGACLSAAGYSVLGIRLAGHATIPEDLLRMRWQDWMGSVEDGWDVLKGCSDQVFLLGLSMGGVLSLITAARLPAAGVVTMSTPYALKADPRLGWLEWLSWLQPSLPKGPPDWVDPHVAEDHVDYPAYPTRAVIQLRDLVTEMQACLPQVNAPVLLIHARNDTGGGFFDPQSMEHIYERLGSKDKQMLWIEGSGHVVTRDAKKEVVFQAAIQFINRVCADSL